MTLTLKPGTLWAKIRESTEHALRCGALHSLPTANEFITQEGIDFLVRILAKLAGKDETKRHPPGQATASAKEFNPFLPYEQDLFVTDVSDTHLCLLNKFNVVDYHLLIITRAFEDQQSPLNLQDWEALWACMREFESLGFYNSGQIAGASQRHKHLQLVPLPLAAGGPKIPIEPALSAARFQDSLGTTPRLPFSHAIFRLDNRWHQSPKEAAEMLLAGYNAMQRAVALRDSAYNLLVTKKWMLLVPRSRECFDSISVNALGFAGALLVRNEQQLHVLKDHGPMTALQSVAIPWPDRNQP
jgi:ATP adenylyltransferase